MFEKYYTAEQLEELKKRGESLGADKMKAAGEEWATLIAKVKDAVAHGVSPTSSEAKEMAAQWDRLLAMFTGGNQKIEANASKMYSQEPGMAAQYGMSKEIFDFIKSARG